MLTFAARRLLQAVPILLGVSLVVFGLVHIVPGNPIDLLMPPEASPEVIAQMKQAFGFDQPLYIQYLLWLGRALRGDRRRRRAREEQALDGELVGLEHPELAVRVRRRAGRPRRAVGQLDPYFVERLPGVAVLLEARRADDGVRLAGVDGEAHVGERGDRAERFVDVVEFDRRHVV